MGERIRRGAGVRADTAVHFDLPEFFVGAVWELGRGRRALQSFRRRAGQGQRLKKGGRMRRSRANFHRRLRGVVILTTC